MINIELRHPEDVMKLSRLGSFHQSKLSFLRSFIREFKNWEFNRDIFDLDKYLSIKFPVVELSYETS